MIEVRVIEVRGRWLRRRAPWLGAAAALLVAAGLVTLWQLRDPGEGRAGEAPRAVAVELNGVEVVAPEGLDLDSLSRWTLAPGGEDFRVRLGELTVHVAPGAKLRQSDRGPPPRLELARGQVAIDNAAAEPLIVRIGDLELVIEDDSVVAIATEDTDGDGELERIVVGVWDGQGLVRPGAEGLAAAEGVVLTEGEAIVIDIDAGGAATGSVGTLDAGPAAQELPPPPEPVAAQDDPALLAGLPEAPPAPEPETVATTTQQTAPAPVAPRELEPGVVEVTLPEESFAVGDVVTVQVHAGVGEVGLGAYFLQLAFRPGDSDLVVAPVGKPRSVPGQTGPRAFLSAFDEASQVLRITDASADAQVPLGTGTFLLLELEMRILEGTPGPKPVGGEVRQLIALDESTIGTPVLQVRNNISIRRE